MTTPTLVEWIIVVLILFKEGKSSHKRIVDEINALSLSCSKLQSLKKDLVMYKKRTWKMQKLFSRNGMELKFYPMNEGSSFGQMIRTAISTLHMIFHIWCSEWEQFIHSFRAFSFCSSLEHFHPSFCLNLYWNSIHFKILHSTTVSSELNILLTSVWMFSSDIIDLNENTIQTTSKIILM